MTNDSGLSLPPFPSSYRASGLLLHVTSLPSPYGIGDVGPTAIAWINQLCDAGQSWWQALPLGPTGYGNSPYQSLSSFAGNGLLISPDWLIQDGLLRPSDCMAPPFSPSTVDYNAVIPFKHRLLEKAWTNFVRAGSAELRVAFGPNQVDQVCFAQFLLFRQGARLEKHARAKGVRLIGDLPFFVSPDSSDVWANPELFLLDDQRRPRFVAGVPPDYFSAQGQLWGNPVYNWDTLRQTDYRWCIDRLRALLAHVDVIRLDHFRAFGAAWHVPAGALTAQSGQWRPGPGADFFNAVRKELGGLPFIAEDLGLITADVHALRDQFQMPGTRVLQFAFDGNSDNPYLPHNYTSNAVVYTGTHDNTTSRGWYEELAPHQRQNFWSYLNSPERNSREVAWDLMHLAWSSPAALAIAPLQDLLNLGGQARMNIPGRAEGNWSWRCTEDLLSAADFHWLRDLTRSSNRVGILANPAIEMAEAAV
ncbi:MAG: 4-alpha-glucanotransferase [Verrucomicrobia bacterium]|nr:MAG: 4-alpha-glucanotransferase [Verrucomicrobiota bacterium]